ncbi:MAG TPA: RNA polymerase sigma-70 factor [Thermoanaerobaculia bacterium]|nr:RNA polymerase sigma-70 factor [Thermoanaerobaculia bacterium]
MNDERLSTFDAHRPLLFSIAYRMTGNSADAEDMVQETFLRWQQVDSSEVQSPRAFLVTIVSRLCINHLQSARVKREEYFGCWLPEPLLTASGQRDDRRLDESLSMAFLLLLERLSPMERAVFLLSEVFDYSHSEVARIVGKSEANCRQILKRARQHISDERPRFEASPEEHEELLQRFVSASVDGDIDGLLSLLSEDIVFYSDGGGRAAAVPKPVYGRPNVTRLLLGARKRFVPEGLVRRIAEVNGQPGIVNYVDGRANSIVMIDVAGDRIRAIYFVSNPDKLSRIPPLVH